ncbi:MAG: hypothetical protein EOP34_12160 [Rickettsiales bacterium]|nr:MAG: hypothetical protein EOP34_12160 [Rickettsiales bacterium]
MFNRLMIINNKISNNIKITFKEYVYTTYLVEFSVILSSYSNNMTVEFITHLESLSTPELNDKVVNIAYDGISIFSSNLASVIKQQITSSQCTIV